MIKANIVTNPKSAPNDGELGPNVTCANDGKTRELRVNEASDVIETSNTWKHWPRYDPSLGLWLCMNCWNRGPMGMKHSCLRGSCECPCTEMKPGKKEKFTDEGQMDIDMTDFIYIGPKS